MIRLYFTLQICFVLETFPEEIVSQGEAALNVYLSCCNEETAVTVFLRVDVVGRDGAGKTSLTKSLTLQKFNADEPSTRGVVFDPKCQIIIKEACNWTTSLVPADHSKVYEKNIVINMADKLDKPEVKDQYFKSKEGPERKRRKRRSTPAAVRMVGSRRKIELLLHHKSQEQLYVMPLLQNSTRALDIKHSSHETVAEPQSSDGVSMYVVGESSGSQQTSGQAVAIVENTTEDVVRRPMATTFGGSNQQNGLKPIPVTPLHASRRTASHDFDEAGNGSNHRIDKLLEKKVTKTAQATVTTTAVKLPADQVSHQYQHQQIEESLKKEEEEKRQSQTLMLQREKRLSHVDNIITENATAVPEHIKRSVSRSLRDPTSRQEAKNEIMATVLDYAGQNVFYITHRLVMSKAGFMYIVFDASKPMNEKTPSIFRSEDGKELHISLFDDETNFDRLEELMSGVHIIEADHSRRIMIFEKEGIRSPPMFLVGTHADQLREQPGMMEEQDKFIRKKLEGTVLAEHVIWASQDVMCFYIDNTMTDPDIGVVDPQVILLRQKTEEAAHKVAQRHRLPVRWLKFDQNVREVKSSSPERKTITISELMDLGKKVAGITSLEELSVVLQYFSSRALLMYCPKALKIGNEEEVVLDIEWLVLQLQKVITIFFEQDVPPMFRNDLKRSKEKGIMTMSFLRHLLSDAGPAQQLIVSLMKHYDLLCQYPAIEVSNLKTSNSCRDFLNFEEEVKGQLDKEEQDELDSQAYFIPCLLEHIVGLESLEMEDERKSLPLLLSSAPLRIPQPLFYRVLTLLCKRFRRLPVIYRNVGYFHIYPGHRLEFALNRYSFRFTVLFEAHATPNSKVCAAIRQWIVNIADKAKQQGMGGLQLQLGFELSGSTSDEFISLDGYQDTRFELYRSMKSREIQCPSRLHLWYPQIQCRDLPLHWDQERNEFCLYIFVMTLQLMFLLQ